MRIRDGIALGALAVAGLALLAAASPGARRFELVSGTSFETVQLMFKIDAETGRVWWTVVGPSKATGKMFVSTWNEIPDSNGQAPATVPSELVPESPKDPARATDAVLEPTLPKDPEPGEEPGP